MWNLPVKCCCVVTRPLTGACIKNTILKKWFSTVCLNFSLELLEQVRKYLPLLLLFCISKQIFMLFYVGTFPLALSAVLPSVVNGCSCCAQSSSASSPVSKCSQAGSCFTTHFFKRTCAHPIRLLKISKYLPNTNFSTQTTAGEKRTLKDTNRSETSHSTLWEMTEWKCWQLTFYKALCHDALINIVTTHWTVAYSHTFFVLITLSHLGATVHLLQFCSSNYILKSKLPGHRKNIRKVKKSSTTELDIIHNSAKHWASTTASKF